MAQVKTIMLNGESNILELLTLRNKTFDVIFTNNTTTIKTPDTKYIVTDTAIPFKFLSFINQVKRHCKKLEPIGPVPKINYMKFRDIENGTYKDLVEIDLNKAYWNAAYKKGYLSKEIFDKGLNPDTPKGIRLIALGALATTKTVYHVEGRERTFVDEIRDEKTARYFFDVSYEVDKVMYDIFLKYPVFWYWVDAFFVPRQYKDDIKKDLASFGLDCSVDEVLNMNVYDTPRIQKADLQVLKTDTGEVIEKTFFIFDENRNIQRLKDETFDMIQKYI